MFLTRFLKSSIKNKPLSYGQYYMLNKNKKRNKKERIAVIKKWYDYILGKK